MVQGHPISSVLAHEDLDPVQVEALLGSSVSAASNVGVLEVSGAAAVECLQGLVTTDIKGPGDGSFLYGAMLTPKGMIITDLWIARLGASVWLTVPEPGMEALLASFDKYLPPRLATVRNHSDEYITLRVVGPRAAYVGNSAGMDLPDRGHTTVSITGGSEGTVARPPAGAPFMLQIQAPQDAAQALLTQLEGAGTTIGSAETLELSRILAGWPGLGAEIGAKTLPQEVRFEEHGGISYTKGCYTGQETVARLHFRGHANRELVGLGWDGESPNPTLDQIEQDGKSVGQVTGVAWVNPLSQWFGLGLLHRKADRNAALVAAGAEASVVPLPMNFGP